MKYSIAVASSAIADIDAATSWIRRESPSEAARWHRRMLRAIRGLSGFPRRCPLIPEPHAEGVEYRQLIVGSGRLGYRAIFAVEGSEIVVLRVRRMAQEPLAFENEAGGGPDDSL